MKMDNINQWRSENFNLEKRPRKFNSWVANKPDTEHQTALFFFYDRRHEYGKRAGGLERGASGRRYIQQKKRASSNIAEQQKTYAPRWKKLFKKWVNAGTGCSRMRSLG